jgi:hypothetical protein
MSTLPGNSLVNSAIDAVTGEPSEQNRVRLYRALQQGVLYLALREDLNPANTELIGEVSGTRFIRTTRDTPVACLSVSTPDGKKALAAFTDVDAFEKRVPGRTGLCLGARDVLQMVVDGGFDGLIINPAGPWAGAPREDVEYILQGVWDTENEQDA